MSRPFRGSGWRVGFLSRRCSGKVPQLELSGECPGFCRVVAVFLSSYDLALRDPLVGLQGSPISKRVAMGPAGFLCSRCQARGPHLQLRPEPQGSSPGTIWISGFLWTPQGGQALSRVEPCKSALLLSQKRSVWLPVGLTIGIGGFLSRCNRASTPAIVF